jgi:hypothetical protein
MSRDGFARVEDALANDLARSLAASRSYKMRQPTTPSSPHLELWTRDDRIVRMFFVEWSSSFARRNRDHPLRPADADKQR